MDDEQPGVSLGPLLDRVEGLEAQLAQVRRDLKRRSEAGKLEQDDRTQQTATDSGHPPRNRQLDSDHWPNGSTNCKCSTRPPATGWCRAGGSMASP